MQHRYIAMWSKEDKATYWSVKFGLTCDTEVQYTGNVTIMLYSMYNPQEFDTLYPHSNTHM